MVLFVEFTEYLALKLFWFDFAVSFKIGFPEGFPNKREVGVIAAENVAEFASMVGFSVFKELEHLCTLGGPVGIGRKKPLV